LTPLLSIAGKACACTALPASDSAELVSESLQSIEVRRIQS
jgi:hypothetical protein